MKVGFMIDKGAYKPEKAYDTDAGFDIRTPDEFDIWPGESVIINTGVHVQIPKGYTGFLKSKSGLNVHYGITSEGVIDCGYTGEIKVKLYRYKLDPHGPLRFHAGDKISQLVILPIPEIELVEIDNMDDTERGAGGFGSTGR